jgi:hypothetical protein
VQKDNRNYDFEGKIDSDVTDKIVCPHCGWMMEDDDFNVDESGTEMTCEDCGKDFYVSLNLQRSYSSSVIKGKDGASA